MFTRSEHRNRTERHSRGSAPGGGPGGRRGGPPPGNAAPRKPKFKYGHGADGNRADAQPAFADAYDPSPPPSGIFTNQSAAHACGPARARGPKSDGTPVLRGVPYGWRRP